MRFQTNPLQPFAVFGSAAFWLPRRGVHPASAQGTAFGLPHRLLAVKETYSDLPQPIASWEDNVSEMQHFGHLANPSERTEPSGFP